MKPYIAFLAIIAIFSGTLSAQEKKIAKIQSAYTSGAYEKCIKMSEKYIAENAKPALPYFLESFSYLELYKTGMNEDQLKSSAKLLAKGIGKEKGEVYVAEYFAKFNEVKDTLNAVATRTYAKKPEKSKPYYKFLAEIYNDTTMQYRELFEDAGRPDAEIVKEMREGTLNQTDAQGKKQGNWKKVYDNGNTAYEVTFRDDKPVGEMKRYHKSGVLQAKLVYQTDGETADAQLFDELEKKIAEGRYVGKNKVGEWKYYENELHVKTEQYVNGQLHGKQVIYYDNGKVYDEKLFENAVENGVWVKYYADGTKMLLGNVKDGKLQGKFQKWHSNGSVEAEGQYADDVTDGKWTYYSDDGANKSVLNYKMGVADNQDEMNEKEAENYRKTLEESKRLIDPQDYKTNPEEYQRKSGGNK